MKLLVLLCVAIAGCYGATVVELLASNPNESELVRLVQLAGLVDTLNRGTFTVFAPTNAAFSKLPRSTLTALENDIPALTNILTYHVLQGRIYKRDAQDDLTVPTVNGKNVRFNIYTHNNVVTVQGAQITEFDREGSNGVIHVIDHVMIPPTGDIVDIASKTPELSTLVSLVGQAGIASALKGDGLTLFAPTNAAFGKLSATVTNRLTTDLKLLADILAYHVVPRTEYSVGLFNRERLRTIDSHNDTVAISANSITGVRVNTARVIKKDISATNGVIHEIDNILVPFRYLGTVIFGRK